MYYLRVKVPSDLGSDLGTIYKRSLRTKDPKEARDLFAKALAECQAHFETCRRQKALRWEPTVKDIHQIGARWFRTRLEKIEELGDFEAAISVRGCPAHRTTIREQLCGQYSLLPRYLSPVALEHLDKTVGYHVEFLARAAEARLHGDWVTEFRVMPFFALSFEKKDLGKTISQVFKAFSEDRIRTDGSGRTVEKTLGEYGKVIKRFTELMGDLPLKQIDRQVIHDFQGLLFKIPSKGTGIRSMSCREQIAKAEAEGLPTLSTVSVSQQMAIISAVLNMGISMGLLQENPVVASGIARRLKKAITKGDRRRKDYILPELQKIFSSPIFRDGMEWSSQRLDLGKALYWIPLLAIYTGARREELCQLYVGDVKTVDGVVCLSILETEDQEDTSGRTVKTSSSRHLVPIHGDLLELGFMEYLEGVPRGGQLFPTLKQGNDGWYGSAFGQQWSRYLREVVKLDSPAKPSHGFRHAFKTLSRSVGIPEDVHDALSGHSAGSVSRGYGQMPLSRLAEEMTKYPSIAKEAGLL